MSHICSMYMLFPIFCFLTWWMKKSFTIFTHFCLPPHWTLLKQRILIGWLYLVLIFLLAQVNICVCYEDYVYKVGPILHRWLCDLIHHGHFSTSSYDKGHLLYFKRETYSSLFLLLFHFGFIRYKWEKDTTDIVGLSWPV